MNVSGIFTDFSMNRTGFHFILQNIKRQRLGMEMGVTQYSKYEYFQCRELEVVLVSHV